MRYFINRVTYDPKSGRVLRIEFNVNSYLETNMKQEDIMSCIQEETEFRLLFAHSLKINTILAKKLDYLSDAQMGEALITGEMYIPDDMYNVTALILDTISWLGMNLLAGSRDEFTVSHDNCKYYWKQTHQKTNLSMSLVHFGHYKASTALDRVYIFSSNKDHSNSHEPLSTKEMGQWTPVDAGEDSRDHTDKQAACHSVDGS